MSTHPVDMHLTQWASPLGPVWLAASAKGLRGLWFTDQKHLPTWLPPAPLPVSAHPTLIRAVTQLDAYFTGNRDHFDVPLDLGAGTPFQQRVWAALLSIPAGQTCSYGELSERIGQPAAVRAVGGAVGRNPVGIIVPCHRVVGANGSLTGYAGGLTRKAALLRLESPRDLVLSP